MLRKTLMGGNPRKRFSDVDNGILRMLVEPGKYVKVLVVIDDMSVTPAERPAEELWVKLESVNTVNGEPLWHGRVNPPVKLSAQHGYDIGDHVELKLCHILDVWIGPTS